MVDVCVAVSLQIPIFTDINEIPEDMRQKRNPNGFFLPMKVDSTRHKRKTGMLVVRNLLVNKEQHHRQWHQQQITNLPCSRSLQHLARQFVVQYFFREKGQFLPLGRLVSITVSLQF
jgi:hypothetical protein